MTALQDITKKLSDATTALAKADNDLKLEIANAAADAAGIFDPTPASDIVGASLSIARGDYLGAALSTVSFIPYVGDAVAKPAKAARATKAIMALEKKVAGLTQTVADLTKAKKQAEAAEVAAKEAKIAKEAEAAKDTAAKQEKSAARKDKDCEDCDAAAKKPAGAMKQARTECFSAKNLDPSKAHEFARQLKRQEEALNKLSVKEYVDARKYFKDHKRSGTGAEQKKARKQYSDKLKNELYESNLDSGMSPKEALKDASEKTSATMKNLAALHEPDMIAGSTDIVTELGDKGVNSSIGAQWKSRVKDLDSAVGDVPAEKHASTKMNVKLPQCK
jgi:hypothetical protein